jgi:hypothetical protein
VRTIGASWILGRRWTPRWLGEVGVELQGVDVDPYSRLLIEPVDEESAGFTGIGGDDLPAGIRDAVGEDGRAIIHVDVQHDTRSKEKRAGTPVSGLWGRLKATGTLQKERSHVGLQGDLRAYRRTPGGALALRLRGAVVTDNAPFYDRLYLGGIYTVRGFPSYSLSAPAGDTWLWSSSVEYRTRILADGKGGTKLAGLFFCDAGMSGGNDDDVFEGVSVGAGYGVRLKVWWLDWVGLDVGFPLTTRPVDQRFQATLSIGWSF